MQKMKIGIFDSGIGGLSIVKHLMSFKELHLYYYADTAHLPYGNKSPHVIKKISKQAITFLKAQGCNVIIIACHTASALAGNYLQKQFPGLIILDILQATIAETLQSDAEKIGIMATSATIQSHIHKTLLLKTKPEGLVIFEQACPELASLIELYPPEHIVIKQALLTYKKRLNPDIDTVILGCTHYNLIKKEIRKIFNNQIKLISSEHIIAQEIEKYFDIKPSKKNKATISIHLTSEDLYMKKNDYALKINLV